MAVWLGIVILVVVVLVGIIIAVLLKSNETITVGKQLRPNTNKFIHHRSYLNNQSLKQRWYCYRWMAFAAITWTSTHKSHQIYMLLRQTESGRSLSFPAFRRKHFRITTGVYLLPGASLC